MNIAQPVASSVDAVDFSLYTTDEIRRISVKRIENANTFDTLGHPAPGGLYDSALGSWGDAVCATCNLNQSQCPGHAGHIELPVPVYNPIFMDTLFRLLRAQCISCKGFRLAPGIVHRFSCKFRLLQHGFQHEAHLVDAIGADLFGANSLEMSQDLALEAMETGKEAEQLMQARQKFVARVLRTRPTDVPRKKHQGADEMRRGLVREFFAQVGKSTRVCATCRIVSPRYRKDKFAKIFEKTLSEKERDQQARNNFQMRDVMGSRGRQKPSGDEADDVDEAIADVDLASVDEPAAESDSVKAVADQRLIVPSEVLARLNELFEVEQDFLALLFRSRPPEKRVEKLQADMFFIRAILVPPNRYRPEAKRPGEDRVDEAQQNQNYKAILRAVVRVTDMYQSIADNSGRRTISSIHEAWVELQHAVNSLMDASKNPAQGQAAKRNAEGIKQILEKKEGLFRTNMMGKRVNFAARSVISPDPNIETNEIGVPPVFAKKLTYPEPVTSHNFRDMQQAVINGVDRWPGASAVVDESGKVVNLRHKSVEQRMAIANQLLAPTSSNSSGTRNKVVYRHLANGDVVIMNRQPTLHKPSMMCHRVRVLPGEKTIRMHYANCNTYNADFDGDEMNMHFPQNERARAEALQIADTDHQYISGTQGKPLRGLIQDHLSVSVALCNKDTFFDRATFQQLLYSALRPESGHILGERLELVPPAILKPVPRWTGKQVITAILRNITPPDCDGLTMAGNSQIGGDKWAAGSEEDCVLFQEGHLVSGILDKSQLGPSAGGLVHAIHEVYGPTSAGRLLSSLGRLLTKYLNIRAFSCGMDDLMLTKDGEATRKEKLKAAGPAGLEVAADYVTLNDSKPSDTDPELLRRLEEVMRDDTKQEGLDSLMNKRCGKISGEVTKACLPSGLEKQFPKNQMQLMTTSGAKGSQVNANLISCNLGQQVLEGRRVPLMVSGKSLPCFNPFETSVRAGGYIVQRFLTGIRPQEYYFHHMAGREGLIDTAVKTARSGYLQRCVIKGMEGLGVAYDLTVRDSDGSLVQFLYGEDGISVDRTKYLDDFGFILRNPKSAVARLNLGPAASRVLENKDELLKYQRSAVKHAAAGDLNAKDPANSVVSPGQFAFATSERFFERMSRYAKENKDGLFRDRSKGKGKGEEIELHGQALSVNRKTAEQIFAMKHFRSMVEPGEAVGIIAGQSIGEPSTQMTLNTFHLAGHAAKNVTLGIPRLREILMVASRVIKTPTMTLRVNEELPGEDGEKFTKVISTLPLSHVLDRTRVKERIGNGRHQQLARVFDIRIDFFPSQSYTEEYGIAVSDVMETVEKVFLKKLHTLVRLEIKKGQKIEAVAVANIGTVDQAVQISQAGGRRGTDGDAEDSSDDDGDEEDATNAKRRANRAEAISYGPNDDEDDEVLARVEEEEAQDDRSMTDEGFGGSPPPEVDADKLAEELATTSLRAQRVLNDDQLPNLTDFRCDEKGGEWCEFTLEYPPKTPKILMLNLVQLAVNRSVIQQIPGIKSCTFDPKHKTKDRSGKEVLVPVIHVEGINIRAMQQYGDFIDPHQIATNDIAAVLDVYGVEACRSNIVQELAGVFDGHGIKVDNRHLNLIADYMTRSGGFTPFNRIGLRGNSSPFTKMSFESTIEFLKEAVMDGDWDELETPSSRLVVGKMGRLGTGSFDIDVKLPTR